VLAERRFETRISISTASEMVQLALPRAAMLAWYVKVFRRGTKRPEHREA
jgi:hypothetical protein